MDFIGREKEIIKLKETFNSNHNEFVAIYGRRRIGKTYLMKNALGDEYDFYYTGIYKQTKSNQLLKFEMTLSKYGKKIDSPFKNWFEAFDSLKDFLLSLNKSKVCVFIDELPWMDSKNSNFVQAFADFYNMWDSFNPNHVILKLYVCGSATTWMINKIIKDKGGLHNRLTNSIHLKQFTLNECRQFFKEILKISYSEMEILDIYMTTGGIPYYLSKFDKKIPVAKQIDELFFKEDAILKDEFNYLYDALFNDSNNYKKIISALANKYRGMTRDELILSTKIEGGSLTEYLENLENCDFIRKYSSPKKKKKESIYQIMDLYTIFYLKFVEGCQIDENHWSNMVNSSKVNSFKGFAFERVILLHVDNVKKALGINGISCDIYSWFKKEKQSSEKDSYQIDLIFDRADNVMNVCEIKYSSSLYKLTKEYNNHVLRRIELLREDLNTKKAIKNTFITTFGIDDSSQIPDISICFDDIYN